MIEQKDCPLTRPPSRSEENVVNHHSDDTNLYDILHVAPGSDEDAIRQAYRKLAREHHPDVAGDIGAEMMKRINAAYRILNDPARRRDYDARHGHSRNMPPAPEAYPPPARPFQRPPPSRPLYEPPPPRPFAGPSTPHFAPPRAERSAPNLNNGPTFSEGPMKLFRQISGDSPIAAMAFAQHDTMLGIGFSDGRIELWHLPSQQRFVTLNLRHGASGTINAGVLHELRLSPTGQLVMAWGLNLGTRVWNTLNDNILWSSSANTPHGLMDGVLFDTPAMARLALPGAPLSLADEDAFHWAEVGKGGTEILTRPMLDGMPIAPAWAVPLRCDEPLPARVPAGRSLRIHQRLLARDGDALLTFSTGPASATISNASIFHLWSLKQGQRTPQLQGTVMVPAQSLWYPLATSEYVDRVATQFEERAIRIYDMRSGQHVELPTGRVSPDAQMALSSDGSLLAIAHPETRKVELWATHSRQRVQFWDVRAPVITLQFSTAQSTPMLAIGRSDGICEMWSFL